jgi:hypothetical protein
MRLHPGFTSIGFGHRLVTKWLRAALEGYLKACDRENVKPAGNVDPGAQQENRLRGKWSNVWSQ